MKIYKLKDLFCTKTNLGRVRLSDRTLQSRSSFSTYGLSMEVLSYAVNKVFGTE